METIFMNSKNSKTSDPHRLLLNLSDKIDLKRSDKYVSPSNLSIYYTWENKKSCKTSISSKLNYLMDRILYQIFAIILSISSKHMKQWLLMR